MMEMSRDGEADGGEAAAEADADAEASQAPSQLSSRTREDGLLEGRRSYHAYDDAFKSVQHIEYIRTL